MSYLTLLESGTFSDDRPLGARRKGVIKMPAITRGGTRGDRKSHGFFVRGEVEFEVRVCDPDPTYYLWLTTEQCELFTDALPIRFGGEAPEALRSIFNED